MRVSPLLLLWLAATPLHPLYTANAAPASEQAQAAADLTKAADAIDREDAERIRTLEQKGGAAVAAELKRLQAEAKTLSEADTRLLLKLLRREGYTAEAGAALESAVARFPQSLPIARFEVAYRRDLQQREKAIEAIHRQIGLEPGALGRLKRAEVFLWNALGQNDKAAEVAKEVVAAEPENPAAHRFLVHAMRRARRFDESRAASREAIRLSKDPYDNLRQLAEMEVAQGNIDAGIAVLLEAREKARSQDKRDEATRWMLPLYDRKGTLAEWLTTMEKELKSDWRQAIHLSSAYTTLGRYHEASPPLAKARKEHGDEPDLLDHLRRVGLIHDKVTAAERLVALEPTAERRWQLAQLLRGEELAGAPEQERILLTEQAEAIQANPYAWVRIYFQLPPRLRTEAMDTLFRIALETRQGEAQGKLRLAETHLLHRQDDAAEALLRELADSPPDAGGALDGTIALTSRIRSAPAHLTAYYQLRQPEMARSREIPRIEDEKMSEEAIRTRAQVYLAALAVERGKAKEYAAKLAEDLAPLPWRERVTALAVAGANERLAAELSAGMTAPDRTPADLQVAVRTLVAAERLRISPELRAVLAKAVVHEVKQRGGSGEWITAAHGLLLRYQEPEAAKTMAEAWLTSEEATAPRSVEAAIRLAAQRGETERMEQLVAARQSQQTPLSPSLYDTILEGYAQAGQTEKMVETALAYYQTLNPNLTYPDPYFPLYDMRDYQSPRYPANLIGFRQARKFDGAIQRLARQPGGTELLTRGMKALTYSDKAAAYRHQLALIRLSWQTGKQEEAIEGLRDLGPTMGDEAWLLVAHLEAQQGNITGTLKTLEQVQFPTLKAYDQVLQTLYQKLPKETAPEEKQRILALRAALPIMSMDGAATLLRSLREARMIAEAAPLVRRIAENVQSAAPDLFNSQSQLQALEEARDQPEAVATLVRLMLDEPPILHTANTYGRWRPDALMTLQLGKKLEAYIAGLENETPLTLPTGLRLASAYTTSDQYTKLPALYEKLLELEPGNATLSISLAETLARQDTAKGAEAYLRLLRESPELLSNIGHHAISFFENHKQLPRLTEYALSLTPETFADPQRVPLSFFRTLADRIQREQPKEAMQIREKGLALAGVDTRDYASLQVDLMKRSAGEMPPELLRQRLLDYFTASKLDDTLLAFSRGNASPVPFLRPPYRPSDGVFRLPEFSLLQTAIQLGLEKQLLAIARENPISEPYLSQLIRLAARDRSVLKELEATGGALVSSPDIHTTVLLTAAHESAEWPKVGDTPLRLLTAAEQTYKKSDNWQQQSFIRQELRIARKLKNQAAADAALQRWYEFLRDTPSIIDYVNVGELCEIGLRMLELNKPEQATHLLSMAKGRARNDGSDPAITRLESLIAAANGQIDNVQAIVALLPTSAGGGNQTLFWSLSPGTATAPGSQAQGPLIPGTPPTLLDGKFDLELLHLTPPNAVRRLGVIKAAKASGVWKGKLPAMTGALGARLISGESRYDGQWTDYAIGANLLAPPDSRKGWTTAQGDPQTSTGGALAESTKRLFPESPAWSPVDTDQEYQSLSARLKPKPGQSYHLSAWFYRPSRRASFSLHLRGFDAHGKAIGTEWLGGNIRNDNGWQYLFREISPESRQNGNFARIAEKAKEIAIELRLSGEAIVTNLQLVEIPDSEAAE